MNYFDKCKQCTIMVGNGTGVLFQPKEKVNYSYILTAKHNLENEDNIEFNFKKIYRHEYLDIAIIKIEKKEFISPNIKMNEPKDKEIYKLYGYSTKRREEEIKIQAFDLEVRDIHKNHEIIVFNRDYDSEQCDINGLSGGGVFQEDGKNFLVAGIEYRMDKELDEEENNTRLRFISIKAFDEIVEKFSDELVYLDDSRNLIQKYNLKVEVKKILLDSGKSFDIKMVKVDLSNKKSLYVSIYPVTFKEYDLFCEDTERCKKHEPDDRGWGRGNRPVINVSWEDAICYCEWLGKEYHLPTSEDWLQISEMNMPNTFLDSDNIYYKQKKTCDVDILKYKGRLDIYHMYGNIYEWCNDKEESSSLNRIALGGSFRITKDIKDFVRVEEKQTLKSPTIGFRIFSIIKD